VGLLAEGVESTDGKMGEDEKYENFKSKLKNKDQQSINKHIRQKKQNAYL